MKTEIKLLDEKAEIPKRAHETDTGYDLKFIGVDKIVGDVIFFKTGLSICPPANHYWEIVPCSRISKQGLSVANSFGVIDEDYRGELIVAIRVHHAYAGEGVGKTQQFANGIILLEGTKYRSMHALSDGILRHKPVLTQMILRERLNSEFVEVEELSETQRGDGGFGSTEAIGSASERKTLLTIQE
tara:strand:+ start:298 stop:855 length:558 start_codon:yes stop_codon:yes gene_type:complete